MPDFASISSSESLKVAVLGVGALGRHHARLLSEMPDVDLVAVVDPNAAQGQAVAEQCRARWIADYRELLEPGTVDAVSIVVPTALHRETAEAFLGENIPVLVEKPIASTYADGEALTQLAASRRIPFQVGHIERFNPAFIALTEKTSRPRYLRAERFSPYSFRSTDISVVHDMMIHDIDLALAITQSRVVSVEALGTCLCGGLVDVAQARLRFDNGCIADLSASRVNPSVRRTFQCWSSTGCWTADLQEQVLTGIAPTPELLSGTLPLELSQQPGADIAALKAEFFERFLQPQQATVTKANALQDELRAFLHSVRTGADPVVDGAAGVAALRVADRILTAIDIHSGAANKSLHFAA